MDLETITYVCFENLNRPHQPVFTSASSIVFTISIRHQEADVNLMGRVYLESKSGGVERIKGYVCDLTDAIIHQGD